MTNSLLGMTEAAQLFLVKDNIAVMTQVCGLGTKTRSPSVAAVRKHYPTSLTYVFIYF